MFDEYVWRAERPLLGRELQLYGLAALSLSSKFQEDEAIFVEVCVLRLGRLVKPYFSSPSRDCGHPLNR